MTESWAINDGDTLSGVHPERVCAGRACVIHAPTNHHMRDWPSIFRSDNGCMERRCKHGIGHPDPDDTSYRLSYGDTAAGVHGCDGCCATL